MRNILAFTLMGLLPAAGCGGDSTTCGAGTQEVDGACVPVSTTECGPGTVLSGTECVPAPDLSPVITALSSPTPFPSGGMLLIEGRNFMAAGAGALTATRDGVNLAGVTITSDTAATVMLPPSTEANVEIAIANALGDSAMTFHYTGYLAASGGDGESAGADNRGHLFVIDPRDGALAEGAPLIDSSGRRRAITGMAFAADGTLYASEARYDDANTANGFFRVDPTTGVMERIGDLTNGVPEYYGHLPDLTFVGATLYAWTEDGDNLCTIDVATGALTIIESPESSNGSAIATLADASIVGIFDGVIEGELLQVINPDGSLGTSVPLVSSVALEGAMASFVHDGSLFAAGKNSDVSPYIGSLLSINPVSGQVEVVAEYPGILLDALDVPPDLAQRQAEGQARMAAVAPHVDWRAVGPSPRTITPTRTAGPTPLRAEAVMVGASVTRDARGRDTMALTEAFIGDAVQVVAGADVRTLDRVAAATHRLVRNQRGRLKLVDAQGRVLLRNVTAINAQ